MKGRKDDSLEMMQEVLLGGGSSEVLCPELAILV